MVAGLDIVEVAKIYSDLLTNLLMHNERMIIVCVCVLIDYGFTSRLPWSLLDELALIEDKLLAL